MCRRRVVGWEEGSRRVYHVQTQPAHNNHQRKGGGGLHTGVSRLQIDSGGLAITPLAGTTNCLSSHPQRPQDTITQPQHRSTVAHEPDETKTPFEKGNGAVSGDVILLKTARGRVDDRVRDNNKVSSKMAGAPPPFLPSIPYNSVSRKAEKRRARSSQTSSPVAPHRVNRAQPLPAAP